MTPREALDAIIQHAKAARFVSALEPSIIVLDRLVTKDEADTKFAANQQVKVIGRPHPELMRHCTCGSAIPCKVWGHS